MNPEIQYMKRCLFLAQKAAGRVSPNPMVGCVIVHNGEMIGEGYHKKYGSHHAEIEAINSIQDKSVLSESTLYVNMEPCSIYGNTPPCCEAITKYNIPKVVIGYIDIDERVNGNGIDYLRDHQVDVTTDILKDACKSLNKSFYTFHEKERPFITLKWAQSDDGFMGKENVRIKISNSISDRLVHKWRAEHDAILVGTQTALTDNPKLTVRLVSGMNPIRLLIDRALKVDHQADIYNEASKTIVFNDVKSQQTEHVEFAMVDFQKNVLEQILKHCFTLKIQSLLIEGGAKNIISIY